MSWVKVISAYYSLVVLFLLTFKGMFGNEKEKIFRNAWMGFSKTAVTPVDNVIYDSLFLYGYLCKYLVYIGTSKIGKFHC